MGTLLKFFLAKYRLQIGIFLVLAVLVGGGVLALINSRPEPPEIGKVEEVSSDSSSESTASATLSEAQERIKVDIAGAVVHPGVYGLSEDGRVEDALEAAGGLSEQADRDWVAKNLNLATKLSDGDKLYIPKVGEATSAPSSVNNPVPALGTATDQSESASGGCSRVNINTASATVLADCLDGIAKTLAERIITYRESHGGFKSIEEIKNVSGIAEGKFAQIKDQITVD